MGVSTRFATAYPARCLQLIGQLEDYARKQELVGSFGLLAASAVLPVPFERAKAKHFLHKDQDDVLTAALKGLDNVKFLDAPFWNGVAPGDWRQWRIVQNWNHTEHWLTDTGVHPFAAESVNAIGSKKASKVLRALRNALAHGNVVHLNDKGQEREGDRLRFLAFLSRYEEGEEAQEQSESYGLTVTTEDDFLQLVKLWAEWVTHQVYDDRAIEAV